MVNVVFGERFCCVTYQVLLFQVISYHNAEGAKGLFTLAIKGDSSHTIAFEDQGDASDFCYLLQSFFENLGDFSAEIVPLPTKVRALMLLNSKPVRAFCLITTSLLALSLPCLVGCWLR